jgi:hypothetical protein
VLCACRSFSSKSFDLLVQVMDLTFATYHMCGGFGKELMDIWPKFKEVVDQSLHQKDPIWYRSRGGGTVAK